jgi:hypothetical protein
MVVSGSFDETIQGGYSIRGLRRYYQLTVIRYCGSFNRDGTTVGSTSFVGFELALGCRHGKCLRRFTPWQSPVSCVKYSPNGKYLCLRTLDSAIHCIALQSRDPTVAKCTPSQHVNTKYSVVSVSRRMEVSLTGSGSRRRRLVYDLQNFKGAAKSCTGHGAVLAIGATPIHDLFRGHVNDPRNRFGPWDS